MPEAFKKAGGIPSPQEKAGGLRPPLQGRRKKCAPPARREPLRASQKPEQSPAFWVRRGGRAGRGRKLLPLFPITEKRLGAATAPNLFLFSFRFRRFLRCLVLQKAARARFSPRPQKGLPFAEGPCPGRPRSVPLTGGAPGRHPPLPVPRLFVKRPGRPAPRLSPYTPRRPS